MFINLKLSIYHLSKQLQYNDNPNYIKKFLILKLPKCK